MTNSTAGIPRASGHDVNRSAVPLSIPLVTSNPRASGTAERALILTHDQIALYMAAFGRVPQDEGEQYAADECLEGQQ